MIKRIEPTPSSALVARIIAGDFEAETEMVETYHRTLLYLLSRRDANSSSVEDIVQETWRIVIEKIRNGKLKNPEKLSSFILQTSRYQQMMYYRKRMKMESDVAPEVLIDTAPSPAQEIDDQITAEIVRHLIDRLPRKRDSELLHRYYIKEEPKDKICRDLGLSDLHFNRVLYRAKQRFAELWKKRKR